MTSRRKSESTSRFSLALGESVPGVEVPEGLDGESLVPTAVLPASIPDPGSISRDDRKEARCKSFLVLIDNKK